MASFGHSFNSRDVDPTITTPVITAQEPIDNPTLSNNAIWSTSQGPTPSAFPSIIMETPKDITANPTKKNSHFHFNSLFNFKPSF